LKRAIMSGVSAHAAPDAAQSQHHQAFGGLAGVSAVDCIASLTQEFVSSR
jgi:hypothetical protein